MTHLEALQWLEKKAAKINTHDGKIIDLIIRFHAPREFSLYDAICEAYREEQWELNGHASSVA